MASAASVVQLPRDPAAAPPQRPEPLQDDEVERQAHWKVPPSVYRVLLYLTPRAVQRARNKQHALGFSHPASHRKWRGRVFSLVRRRIRDYELGKLLKLVHQSTTKRVIIVF